MNPRRSEEKIFEETVSKNIPNLMKYMNIHNQESQKNYHQDKLKENQTMTHYNQNVERKDRENLKRSKREVIHHI